MSLLRLQVTNIRNITTATLFPIDGLNIIYGENGSGKTTLLEAISILASGKSFRSKSIRTIITHSADALTVFGMVATENTDVTLGIERSADAVRFKIAGNSASSLSELAYYLPIQFIGPDLQKVLEQGPKLRRSLVDWGVFHVEHSFFSVWTRYNKLLKQRNALLKRKDMVSSLDSWDRELLAEADRLTSMRKSYLALLDPLFNYYVAELCDVDGIRARFYPGWNDQQQLSDILTRNIEKDLLRGFTQYGPHRADFIFKVGNQLASEMLSRGQMKLVVIAFKLAQVALLDQLKQHQCVILLDDLPSELDLCNRQKVLSQLLKSKSQLFVTCTDPALLGCELDGQNKKMFHVEQGLVTEVV